MLYPLKFRPILKDRIWGGQRLKTLYNKEYPDLKLNYGESWELSPVHGSMSLVTNGMLKGNTIGELVEIYMGDLLGEQVFNEYGANFPLLIKLIDAADSLSVQVHPDDNMANELHGANGKSEMWYVLHAEEGAEIVSGLKPNVTKLHFASAMDSGEVVGLLNSYSVLPDDFFYIPAGTVHAIGKNIVLLEVQQASDITYRIYDWDRIDSNGQPRELHKQQALEAIDFNSKGNGKLRITPISNQSQNLLKCKYFNINRLNLTVPFEIDRYTFDSFALYFCVDGSFKLIYQEGEVNVGTGELVLVPAEIKAFSISPKNTAKVIEVTME